MRRLAYTDPIDRLVYNLKVAASRLKPRPIANTALTALSGAEREILMIIDAACTLESRRTAHSLLDVEARFVFISCAVPLFLDRWERARHRLWERPLDNTVRRTYEQKESGSAEVGTSE